MKEHIDNRLQPTIEGAKKAIEAAAADVAFKLNRLSDQDASLFNETYTVDSRKQSARRGSDCPLRAFTPDGDVEAQRPEPAADEESTASNGCCCSWSRLCDVMGNREGGFIDSLRPLRLPIIQARQCMVRLQVELERGMRLAETTSTTAQAIGTVIDNLNQLNTNKDLNIPPDENEMFRRCALDLSVLARVIYELCRYDAAESLGLPPPDEESGHVSEHSPTFVRKGISHRNTAAGGSAVDEHSLKERIERNNEMLEKLLKFIDKKTERRWWLRDVLTFSQLLVKLALFVSASVSVFYYKEQTAPIITLALTIIQGVIDILDQYFLRKQQPEDIKLHVVTTISAAAAKS